MDQAKWVTVREDFRLPLGCDSRSICALEGHNRL